MDVLFVISLSLTVAVLVAMTVKAAILCRRLARMSPRHLLPCMLFPASQIVCVAGIAATTMLLHLEPATLFLALALGVACIPLDSLLFTALGKAEHADALREQARLLKAQIDAERMGARGLVSVENEARDIRRKIAEQLHELDAQLSRGEVASSGQRMDEIIVLATRKNLGAVLITEGKRLIGIITDGDLRRALVRKMKHARGDAAERDAAESAPARLGKAALVAAP